MLRTGWMGLLFVDRHQYVRVGIRLVHVRRMPDLLGGAERRRAPREPGPTGSRTLAAQALGPGRGRHGSPT